MDEIKIKEMLLNSMTAEWESGNSLNTKIGCFPYYVVKKCLDELIKDNKVDSLQIRSRIKYRRRTEEVIAA
jgi:hypothetical protein